MKIKKQKFLKYALIDHASKINYQIIQFSVQFKILIL